MNSQMDFSEALVEIKGGNAVAREGWNGPDQRIFLVQGAKVGPVKIEDFIAIKTVQGDIVPWLASQADLLTEDWVMA